MKKGKIILSVAALVVTAGSTLAFKVANTFGTHHNLFAQVSAATGGATVCATCSTIFTKAGGIQVTSCLTVGGQRAKGIGSGHTFYTAQNSNKTLCVGRLFSRVTKVH